MAVSLGSITKAGNPCLRELLVVGAMAVVRRAKKGSTKRPWVAQLLARKKPKVAAVALANKNARIIRAMLATGEPYREPELAAALEIAPQGATRVGEGRLN
ncbi:transposase [Erythrobacter sp. NFXS35]